MTYTDTFYDTIRSGCRSSADVIVPLLIDDLAPATVLDVGCGEGWFGAAFEERGVTAVGIDGEYVGDRQLERFVAHDLGRRLPDELGVFDVVVCLEVAEHLPARRARSFVDDLCTHAVRAVVFSAAIPGQGGAGHVNEQWPAYWSTKFAENGWATEDRLRWRLWGDDRVEPWYQQNLLVFEREPGAVLAVAPPAVVHPTIYDARRAV